MPGRNTTPVLPLPQRRAAPLRWRCSVPARSAPASPATSALSRSDTPLVAAMTDNPWIDPDRIRHALEALGLTGIRSTDPDRPVDPAFLAGALLLFAELAGLGADRGQLAAGYRWAAGAVTAEDSALADSVRARLAVDRLHRTADALPANGEGKLPLAEVAGPAAMAAANVLALTIDPAPTPAKVADAVNAAGASLRDRHPSRLLPAERSRP